MCQEEKLEISEEGKFICCEKKQEHERDYEREKLELELKLLGKLVEEMTDKNRTFNDNNMLLLKRVSDLEAIVMSPIGMTANEKNANKTQRTMAQIVSDKVR